MAGSSALMRTMCWLRPLSVAFLLAVLGLGTISSACRGQFLEMPSPPSRLLPICADGLVGFVDATGRVVVKPEFTALGPVQNAWRIEPVMFGTIPVSCGSTEYFFDGFHEGVCIVSNWPKYGFLRDDGELILASRYDQVTAFAQGYAWGLERIGETSCRLEMVDREGQILFRWAERVAPGSEGLVAVRIEGQWGFIDYHGRLRIRPRYEWVGRKPAGGYDGAPTKGCVFCRGTAQVWQDGLTGVIDRTGQCVVPIEFASIERYDGGFAASQANGRVVCFDVGGNRLDGRADRLEQGLEVFEDGGRYGYRDTTGNTIIAPVFRAASSFEHGIAIVTGNDGQQAVIGRSGEYIVPPGTYDSVRIVSERLIQFVQGAQQGFIDFQGNRLLPLDFSDISQFAGGEALVRDEDGRMGVVSECGALIVEPRFAFVDHASEGLRRFMTRGKKWGFCDVRGRVVIKPRFDHADSFHYGIALVSVEPSNHTGCFGGWGYINLQGDWIWKPEQDRSQAGSAGG